MIKKARLRLEQICFFLIARLLLASYRIRYFNTQAFYAAQAAHSEKSFCLASWHEHALAGVLGQTGLPYVFLISQSRDGDYVSFLSKKLGFQTVRGSSSRGGPAARTKLEEAIASGVPAAFTVDGPRGPRRACKAGVLATAIRSKTHILPVTALSRSPWVIEKAWDRTKIPPPFSKIVYQYGDSIDPNELMSSMSFEQALEVIGKKIDQTEKYAFQNLQAWSSGEKNLP